MRIRRGVWECALALGVAAGIVGCGGPSCGEGTVEMDGACVPESMLRCGPGTVEDATGACVPEDVDVTTCGEGTTLNAATGECEPDVECGTGTTAMAGECVPDGTVICDDGTMFDATTGTCVGLEGSGVCADGTTLVDGECVPDDETLMGEVFAAAEPDDPSFDGTPATFIPPAVGAERTLEGCITADDFDGDGVTDSDLDFFGFSVSGPGLFRINADGLGGLAAGFVVLANDGPLADQGWFRFALNYAGDTSERRVYLPRAGNYTLIVFDTRSYNVLAGDWLHPVGTSETCYFVTVEAEAIPTPTPITDGSETGTLGDPQFYSVTAATQSAMQVQLFEAAPNAVAGLVTAVGDRVTSGFVDVVDADDPEAYPDQALVFSPVVAADADVLLVVDEVLSVTPDPVSWRMTIGSLGQIPDDGTITLNNDPDDEPFYQFGFIDAVAGDVLHIRLASDELDLLGVRIFNPDFSAAYSICALTTSGVCDSRDVYYAVEQTGPQLVQFINVTAEEDVDYHVTFEITRQTPPALTSGTALDLDLVDTRTFVRVNTSSQEWTRYEVTSQMGTGFTVANVGFHADEGGLLPSPAPDGETGVGDGGAATWLGRIPGPTFGGPFLVEVSDPSGFDGDESTTVLFREETFADVTVSPTAPHTATGVAIPSGDTTEGLVRYLVRALPGGELTFSVTGTAGTDPQITLLDYEHDAVLTVNATGADGTETFVRRVPSSGWFAIGVSNTDPAAGTIDVSITQSAPPYTATRGTTTFASICPDAGGSGSVVTLTAAYAGIRGADEGTTDSPVPFTTFTGFEFFGGPVASYQISSNGFISFSTTPLDDPYFFPEAIGTPGTPDALVAGYWRDLISEQVCVQEDATRFVVEMSGTGYDFFVSEAPYGVLQLQMILTAATGTIELVYGPRHDLELIGPEGIPTTIGIENADGTIGIPAGLPPTGGTSILFTPGS